MAQSLGIWDLSFVAGEDLSSLQYAPVKEGANGVVTVAVDNERPIGFLQNKPRNGEAATVRMLGISKAKFAAALTRPNLVRAAASADKGEVRAAAGSDNQWLLGSVWSPAGAEEIGSVLINIQRADTTA